MGTSRFLAQGYGTVTGAQLLSFVLEYVPQEVRGNNLACGTYKT